MSTQSCGWRILFDLIIVAAVGISVLLFKLVGVPYKRGFFCDDESIRLSFKDSTITSLTLYIVGFFVPVILMFGTEAYHYKQGRLISNIKYTIKNWKLHPLLYICYLRLFVFGFGCCCSQLATDIGKYSVGRLRPHFIDVCRPDVGEFCTRNAENQYIVNYNCLGDPALVEEARLSFPSGHSSFSAYTMLFLVLYVQARMSCFKSLFVKPFIQFIAIMAAFYTALSRISDHKHHWSDVLFGSILGSTVALLIVHFVSDFFKPKSKEDSCLVLPLTTREDQCSIANGEH